MSLLPRQESFASLHILTRRASEGSEALPSLARRVRMSFYGARVISPPMKVRTLQAALHTKAKNSPDIDSTPCTTRFIAATFWASPTNAAVPTAAHRGSTASVFADIEAYGKDRWLDELAEELRNETYQPKRHRPKPPLYRLDTLCGRAPKFRRFCWWKNVGKGESHGPKSVKPSPPCISLLWDDAPCAGY